MLVYKNLVCVQLGWAPFSGLGLGQTLDLCLLVEVLTMDWALTFALMTQQRSDPSGDLMISSSCSDLQCYNFCCKVIQLYIHIQLYTYKRDSVKHIYVFFFSFFSFIGYYMILCYIIGPCYLLSSYIVSINLILLVIPPYSLPLDNHKFAFYLCETIFIL